MRQAIKLSAFTIGMLFVGFGATHAGIYASQIRTIETDRQRYGALEDVVVNEQSASLQSNDDAIRAMQRHDEFAKGLAAQGQTYHSNNVTMARLNLGLNSSNLEQGKLLEVLSKQKTNDLNVAFGLVLLLVWLSFCLMEAGSNLAASSTCVVSDEAWLTMLQLDPSEWDLQTDSSSPSESYVEKNVPA